MCKASPESQVLVPQLMTCFCLFVCLFVYLFVLLFVSSFLLLCFCFLYNFGDGGGSINLKDTGVSREKRAFKSLLTRVVGMSFGLIGGWGDSKLQLAVVGKLSGWMLELNFAGQIINFKSLLIYLFFYWIYLFLYLFICIYLFIDSLIFFISEWVL